MSHFRKDALALDTRRNCPACFRLKAIPAPLPVCRTCIGKVPNKLQAELVSALNSGNAKEILRVSAEVVTTAWAAQENKDTAAIARAFA